MMCSCALWLLNEHLSHGYYEVKSQTFKNKLPSGALCSKAEIMGRSNGLGGITMFVFKIGLLME